MLCLQDIPLGYLILIFSCLGAILQLRVVLSVDMQTLSFLVESHLTSQPPPLVKNQVFLHLQYPSIFLIYKCICPLHSLQTSYIVSPFFLHILIRRKKCQGIFISYLHYCLNVMFFEKKFFNNNMFALGKQSVYLHLILIDYK